MTSVSVDEIESDLEKYLRLVEEGETLIVLRSNKPVAELRPIAERPLSSRRPVALCAGEFVVPDDFDSPLPEEVLAEFEGR